jgi:hypothetical protein
MDDRAASPVVEQVLAAGLSPLEHPPVEHPGLLREPLLGRRHGHSPPGQIPVVRPR